MTVKENPALMVVNDDPLLTTFIRGNTFIGRKTRGQKTIRLFFSFKKNLKQPSKPYLYEKKLKLIVIKLRFISEVLLKIRSFKTSSSFSKTIVFFQKRTMCCINDLQDIPDSWSKLTYIHEVPRVHMICWRKHNTER